MGKPLTPVQGAFTGMMRVALRSLSKQVEQAREFTTKANDPTRFGRDVAWNSAREAVKRVDALIEVVREQRDEMWRTVAPDAWVQEEPQGLDAFVRLVDHNFRGATCEWWWGESNRWGGIDDGKLGVHLELFASHLHVMERALDGETFVHTIITGGITPKKQEEREVELAG